MQDNSGKFDSFILPDFPKNESSVYIISCVKDDKEIPIYVGETDKLRRRIGDYIVASFQASTDFKVGEAIRYFQEKGCKITIRYKGVQKEHRRGKEDRIIDDLRKAGYRLLNDLVTYNYKTADEEKERARIAREFCDNILKSDRCQG